MNIKGFDNQKYLTTQSEQIKKRIAEFEATNGEITSQKTED
jgi:uncharacterized protein (UPF0371 family)